MVEQHGHAGVTDGDAVDRATGATSIPKLYAGGDCIRGGGEIVDAVQDGKLAAWAIDAALTALEK